MNQEAWAMLYWPTFPSPQGLLAEKKSKNLKEREFMTAKAIHQFMRDISVDSEKKLDFAYHRERCIKLENEFYLYGVHMTDPEDEEAQTVFHASGWGLNGDEVKKFVGFICPGMEWQDNFRALSMEWGGLKLYIQRNARTFQAILKFAQSLPKSAPGNKPRDITVSFGYWHSDGLSRRRESFCVSKYELNEFQKFMEQVDFVPEYKHLGSSCRYGNAMDMTISTAALQPYV